MLFIIYLSVTCIIGIWITYLFRRCMSRKKLLTIGTVTTGVVTKAEKTKSGVKVEKDEDIYKIKAEYAVDGKTYTTSMGYSTSKLDLDEGQAIEIVYDEKNPSKAVPKRYADCEKVSRLSIILGLVIFFLCFFVTVITMPTTLHMSKEGKSLHTIIIHAIFAVFVLLYFVIGRRTESYKKECEKDPKTMKKNNVFFAGVFIECIWQIITEIVFK